MSYSYYPRHRYETVSVSRGEQRLLVVPLAPTEEESFYLLQRETLRLGNLLQASEWAGKRDEFDWLIVSPLILVGTLGQENIARLGCVVHGQS